VAEFGRCTGKPVKDGFKAIEELRTTHPGVKIVADSGGAAQAPSVLEKGANAFPVQE
jgi:3-keto-L-gulonate-6-phosphate decarboxylase